MAASFNPFRNLYRYLQSAAHENPAIFFSFALGGLGPLMVLTIPPIRKSMGWKKPDRIPTSYPMPDRPREQLSGYDDE